MTIQFILVAAAFWFLFYGPWSKSPEKKDDKKGGDKKGGEKKK